MQNKILTILIKWKNTLSIYCINILLCLREYVKNIKRLTSYLKHAIFTWKNTLK